MNTRLISRFASASCIAFALSSALLLSACNSKPKPANFNAANLLKEPAKPPVELASLSGTVLSLAVNARNLPETFILRTDNGSIVFSVPDALSDALAFFVKPGDHIEVTAIPTPAPDNPSAPQFALFTFRDHTGTPFTAPGDSSRSFSHVSGTITAVIVDRRGHPTSLLLNTGEIVRLLPRASFPPDIAEGEPFTADGPGFLLSANRRIVQADLINGLSLRVNLPPGGWGVHEVTTEGDMGGDMGDGGGDFGGE